MVLDFKPQPPSTEVRAFLKEQTDKTGNPVIVNFSTGKDAIGAVLAMKDDGIPMELVYDTPIPVISDDGERIEPLGFVKDTLAYQESIFGQKIHVHVSRAFFRKQALGVLVPPDRWKIIQASGMRAPDNDDATRMVRKILGLPDDTWVCDGVRAADSLMRRMVMKKSGPIRHGIGRVSPIYDWQIADIRERMADHNMHLPVDYEMFPRSFDGLSDIYLSPIKERFPEDYEHIRFWYPLAEMERLKHERAEL